MPRQPEVHFRLKPIDKNGLSTIYLQFIYNKQRLFYSFGQAINPKDWNLNKERVKNKQATTTDGKFAINELLDSLKAVCQKTYYESLKDGIPDPETLRDALEAFFSKNHQDLPKGKNGLYTLIEKFKNGEIKIRSGKNTGRDKGKSCLNNYNTTYKHLTDFEKAEGYKVDFDSITLDFFYKYVNYLSKKKKLAHNTIAKDISTLKVFLNEAVEQGLTDNLQFKKKGFSYSEEETDHVYLTEKELTDLYNFDLSKHKKLEQVRDLFIFGAWVGLRYSDFSNIKPENIVKIDGDYFIKTITQKTKEQVIIPCNPVVLELFNKYKTNANKLPKKLSLQKFNEYIKDACKMAGMAANNPVEAMIEKGRLSTNPNAELWECVSSHTCRRSMATNYYLQGFPTIDLMKITAHKTERSFLKYIRVTKLDTAKRLAAHIKANWSRKMLKVV